jgi:hypothetical protein
LAFSLDNDSLAFSLDNDSLAFSLDNDSLAFSLDNDSSNFIGQKYCCSSIVVVVVFLFVDTMLCHKNFYLKYPYEILTHSISQNKGTDWCWGF